MHTPMILKIYESKECEGVLAPYIITDEISALIDGVIEKNVRLHDLLSSIPDMTTISGGAHFDTTKRAYGISQCLCDEISIKSADVSSVMGSSAKTEAEKVAANNQTHVLPPHKVHYGNDSDAQPVYESNIYTPCLHEPSDHFVPEVAAGVFPTGTYPNEVPSYSTFEEYRDSVLGSNNTTTSDGCVCAHDVAFDERVKMSLKRRVLETELVYNTFEGIKDSQISNLLSALVLSNRIPLNCELIQTLRIVLDTFVAAKEPVVNVSSMIGKIGVYTETVRTISHPTMKTCLRVFVEVSADCYKQIVGNVLLSVLKRYNDNISVVLLTPDEFVNLQQSHPINLCFDCMVSNYVTTAVSTFDMTLVNANMFVCNVKLSVHTPSNVQIAAPSSIIEVATGTSGMLQFIVNNVGERSYTVDKIRVNDHMYDISDLTDINNNVGEFEYSKLSAEISQSTDESISEILTLRYNNIISDIYIDIQCIAVLTETECEIETDEITAELSEILGYKLSFGNNVAVATVVETSNTLENTESSESESGKTETSEGETSSNVTNLYLKMSIPFNNVITKIRRPELIEVKKILREFDPGNRCVKYKMEPIDSFDTNLSSSASGSSLVKNSCIDLTGAYITESLELVLCIGKGALLSSQSILSTTLPATNEYLELHFAIDHSNKLIELMGEVNFEDIPKYYEAILGGDTGDEPTVPDTPGEDVGISNKEIDKMYGL